MISRDTALSLGQQEASSLFAFLGRESKDRAPPQHMKSTLLGEANVE
jgi:hypothetical protein